MDNTWYGQSLETDKTEMVEPGTGKPYILRIFDFAINPSIYKELKEKKVKPTKQDLFNYHWPHLRTLLWADGLVANEDCPPRVEVSRGGKKYRIFLLCEPKFRNIVVDKMQTLQEILKK